jgi:signal peptide peptidase SppA
MIKLPEIWIGSDRSFDQLAERMRMPVSEGWEKFRLEQLRSQSSSKVSLLADPDVDDVSMEDYLALSLIELYDNVGIINISGGLTSEESVFNNWFGMVGYPTITRALNMLLDEESVSDIVMTYATPGGAADGIGEASDAILSADRIKPVYAWTGSEALSAGYWLASSARKIYSTKVAQTGSIGAITTFMSRARMLKENGIDPLVVRSAPKKAIPHPYEPITAAGRDKLKSTVDFFHGLFAEHVASRRTQLSLEGSKESWASGETFFGQQALEMGLIDGPLQTVDTLISRLITAHNDSITSGDSQMAKRFVLSGETDRASILAGVPLSSVAFEEQDSAAPGAGEGDSNADAGDEPAPLAASGETAGEGEGAETQPESREEPTSAPAAATSGSKDVMLDAFLGQIKELRAENAQLSEQLTRLKIDAEKLGDQLASYQALAPLMCTAIERLEIGLGHRKSDLSSATPAQLEKTYNSLYSELMGLPTGRQSAPAAEDKPAGLSASERVVAERLAALQTAH